MNSTGSCLTTERKHLHLALLLKKKCDSITLCVQSGVFDKRRRSVLKGFSEHI